jgi:hypothetical protein
MDIAHDYVHFYRRNQVNPVEFEHNGPDPMFRQLLGIAGKGLK